MTRLIEQVRPLLALATQQAAGHVMQDDLADELARLDEPLRVAVAGRVKAGKSTLVNAMVGELVAPTDARECTRVVTWYRDGVTYRVEGVSSDGVRSPLRFDRDGGALEIDLGDRVPEELACLEVTWPSRRLGEMTLVDTPGIDSLAENVSERTERFLRGGSERPTPTDAVLYLLRHVHSGDIHFLEAFHDDHMAAANPVNSVGVLSRADEIGVSRLDALESASRIAHRWRSDKRLNALVQTVVPVSGLLAEAASTLRQPEFDAFATMGCADAALIEELLVSADRFARSSADVGVVDLERSALLDRFGLFGCRMSIDLIRTGRCTSATTLADRLLDASGLRLLRSEISQRFAHRRDLLKARSALAWVQAAAVALGDRELAAEVERTLDGAHEFAELRVLNALRRGDISFDDRRTTSARVLLGESGMQPGARAGLASDATPAEAHESLGEQLSMWQAEAEHPLATPDAAAAARVLTRTCEGLLAALQSS